MTTDQELIVKHNAPIELTEPTGPGVIFFLGVVFLFTLVAIAGFALANGGPSPKPSPMGVIEVPSSLLPTPTPSEEMPGYRVSEVLIKQAWDQMSAGNQKILCDGWGLLPHEISLSALTDTMTGQGIGVTDAEYRKAAKDFFNKTCE